jgi:hypothetical protein
VKPSAVEEALHQALAILQIYSPEIAVDWLNASRVAAAKGDHRPAMHLLQSIGVVEPIPQAYDSGKPGATAAVNVQFVGFQMAGLPSSSQSSTTSTTVNREGHDIEA